jgi:dTDP-4-dehydrorhamnose 3,5-epimerase-like enzyme
MLIYSVTYSDQIIMLTAIWKSSEFANPISGIKSILVITVAFAHEFLTLLPKTTVVYPIEEQYRSGSAVVLRWADPQFFIRWTSPPDILSNRDSTASDLLS